MTDGIKSVFKRNLKKQLDESGTTQLELAKYLNVSNTAVNNWIKGHSMPRMDKIDNICRFFGIQRSELLGNGAVAQPSPTPIPETIAAHLDGADLSNTDVHDIADFIDYVIQRKAKKGE